MKNELILGDLGGRPLQACGACHGVYVSAATSKSFERSSESKAAEETKVDLKWPVYDLVCWIIAGVFEGL